jgi:hypothetical protein
VTVQPDGYISLRGIGSVERPPPAPDAGPPDAGGGPAPGPGLSATVTYTETRFDLLAVDPAGTAYGVDLSGSPAQIWASVDGRSWSKRGGTDDGARFLVMTSLSDGTLLADVKSGASHALARSTDHGVTWSKVLDAGAFQMVTTNSIAELEEAVYFAEDEGNTSSSTTIRL